MFKVQIDVLNSQPRDEIANLCESRQRAELTV